MTHITLGRSPLDEGSARRRVLYLKTNNLHNRQISIRPAGFEPAIPASGRPQTHLLHLAATGIGELNNLSSEKCVKLFNWIPVIDRPLLHSSNASDNF